VAKRSKKLRGRDLEEECGSMHHVEQILDSLLGSEEFLAAVVATFLSVLITGWFVLRAQKQEVKDQRMRDRSR
jgi:hypothetical protein